MANSHCYDLIISESCSPLYMADKVVNLVFHHTVLNHKLRNWNEARRV